NSFRPQHTLDVFAELLLGVEFLERTPPSENTVPELYLPIAPPRYDDLGSNNKGPTAQFPGSLQSARTLGWLLDHVNDIPEIHYVRRLKWFTRTKGGVPARAFDAIGREKFEILAM